MGFRSFRSSIICPKRPFAHENLMYGDQIVSNAISMAWMNDVGANWVGFTYHCLVQSLWLNELMLS